AQRAPGPRALRGGGGRTGRRRARSGRLCRGPRARRRRILPVPRPVTGGACELRRRARGRRRSPRAPVRRGRAPRRRSVVRSGGREIVARRLRRGGGERARMTVLPELRREGGWVNGA